jgi:hypothetical protein
VALPVGLRGRGGYEPTRYAKGATREERAPWLIGGDSAIVIRACTASPKT